MNILVTLCLLAPPAQEDVDSDLERLAGTLATTGATPKLAALLKTDAGRLVVKEKIAERVAKGIERIDKDPQAQWERSLFAEDADGLLRVRADRKVAFETLARDVARRAKAFAAFDRAGLELAKKIPAGETENCFKAAWENREYRLALYQRLGADQREATPEELWVEQIGRSLQPGSDGKVRLRGSYRDDALAVIAGVKAEVDSFAAVEEQLAAALSKLADKDRTLASTPEGKVAVARRLLQLAGEGVEDPPAKFPGEFAGLTEEIASLASMGADLRPIAARAADLLPDDLEDERRLKGLLKDERAVVCLATLMRTTRDTRAANAAAAVNPFRDDAFDVDENGALTLKKGRFVDENAKESAAAAQAEVDAALAELAATRASLADQAERAGDPAIAAIFQAVEGASAVAEHNARVLEDLKQAERELAVQKFIRSYLVKEGERFALRPDRVPYVEAMAERAVQVQATLEEAAKEGKDK